MGKQSLAQATTKPLAQTARKSSTQLSLLTAGFRRQSSSNRLAHFKAAPGRSVSHSAEFSKSFSDCALTEATKRSSLKKRPASARQRCCNSIFVLHSAWQATSNGSLMVDSPPSRPNRDESLIMEDQEEEENPECLDDAPPSMPMRKSSVQDYANACKPQRLPSVQNAANACMPTRKLSVQNTARDAMECTNEFHSGLASQRNFVFGEMATAKPSLSSFWDNLRKPDGSKKPSVDKPPASYQRKVSVSEINAFASIRIQSSTNLQGNHDPTQPQQHPQPPSTTSPNSVILKPMVAKPNSNSHVDDDDDAVVVVRDVNETWACIQRNYYALTACGRCQAELTCIRDVDQVQCPTCHSRTPNNACGIGGGGGGGGGIGIGLTLQDLRRCEQQQQQEMGGV